MSLQVWLPLTKDLRQQGLSNVTVTNNGATYSATGGKLGGCYNFTNQNIVVPSTSFKGEFTNNQASLAAWVKVTTSHSAYAQALVLGTQGTSWNNILFGIDINGSGTPIANASTGSAYTNLSFGTAIKDGVWHHIVYTYNAGTMKVYLDGVQKATTTTSNTPAWTSSTNLYIGGNTGGEKFQNGDGMNDVRVYNHCLSPMEVKELAKGLVLHYPLNRQGWGQENLLARYVVPGQGAPTSTASGGRTTWLGDYAITIPATENADTYFRLFMTEQLVSGQIYTISCQASGLISGTYYNFPMFAQNNSSMGYLSINHNGLCTMTFTMTWTGTQTAATGANGETVYVNFLDDITRTIATGQGPITLTHFKLEKGSVATPWCPNSSDTLATTMGLNSTIEYDCSGFCNNGTWHGTHTNTSDTPKYAVSTTATGSGTTYLEGPVLPAEAKTVALWIKNTSKSSNGAIFNDKTSGLQIGLLNSLLYMNSKASTAGFTTTHWVNEEWNHVVAINNDGTRSLYVNGQPETQSGASNYYIHNADNCWLWNRSYNNSYPFTGSLCDLRIYATALSASDVKSLYQNSAYIDSSGNVYGAVHTEV